MPGSELKMNRWWGSGKDRSSPSLSNLHQKVNYHKKLQSAKRWVTLTSKVLIIANSAAALEILCFPAQSAEAPPSPLCTCPSCSLPISIDTSLFPYSLCRIMYWAHVAIAFQHSCGSLLSWEVWSLPDFLKLASACLFVPLLKPFAGLLLFFLDPSMSRSPASYIKGEFFELNICSVMHLTSRTEMIHHSQISYCSGFQFYWFYTCVNIDQYNTIIIHSPYMMGVTCVMFIVAIV